MTTTELTVGAYGVVFSVVIADPEHVPAVAALLPPGHEPADPAAAATTFRFAPDAGADLVEALGALDAAIRLFVATHAPDLVFVHAGVVARGGRALVLPAATFAGKSELTAALVRAGATYYSDEYAVIDRAGLVHPYARALSLRPRGARAAAEVPAAMLGGMTGTQPVPIGLIAATVFDPSASWDPAERTTAAGALLLLAHAGQAREHPERVLDTLERAAAGARVLEGPRGEAEEAAAALLAALS